MPERLGSVAWSPDGKWLAACGRPGKVYLRDLENSRLMTLTNRAKLIKSLLHSFVVLILKQLILGSMIAFFKFVIGSKLASQ